jgi:hypothetical protein
MTSANFDTYARQSHEMYGCDIAAFIAIIEQSPTFVLAGPDVIIMSLLSDCQALISDGHGDAARQTINRAKFMLCHYKLGLRLE